MAVLLRWHFPFLKDSYEFEMSGDVDFVQIFLFTARSHGKKFQINVEKETCRILANLGWVYMQLKDYTSTEAVYREAQVIKPDANKACNLSSCLIKQGKKDEARLIFIRGVLLDNKEGTSDPKPKAQVKELLSGLEPQEEEVVASLYVDSEVCMDEVIVVEGLDEFVKEWKIPYRTRRLPIFEEILSLRDH